MCGKALQASVGSHGPLLRRHEASRPGRRILAGGAASTLGEAAGETAMMVAEWCRRRFRIGVEPHSGPVYLRRGWVSPFAKVISNHHLT